MIRSADDVVDMDALERGELCKIIAKGLYDPVPYADGWKTTTVFASQCMTEFRMYSEGENKRFLLGAKLFDRDCAFIFASNASLQSAITEYLQASLGSISLPSMSYDSGRSSFAAAGDVVRPMNFGAGRVMRQESDKPTFLFTMNSCQQCDSEKGLFTCGGEREDERESLARMVYSVRRFRDSDFDVRCVHLTLPAVDTDSNKRVCWCPRAIRSLSEYKAGRVSSVAEALICCPEISTRCMNKLPEWSEQLQSLVLKFFRNRIKAASTCNMIIYRESRILDCQQQQQQAAGAPAARELQPTEAVMQFGKRSGSEYALDYRHPLSALQAFAVALSSLLMDSELPPSPQNCARARRSASVDNTPVPSPAKLRRDRSSSNCAADMTLSSSAPNTPPAPSMPSSVFSFSPRRLHR